VVATPEGGRIVTEHRCPCRTMGTRPALTIESAKFALARAGGRLVADDSTPRTIRMAPRKYVRFSSYRRIEHTMIDRLLGGDPVPAVLGEDPFPDIGGRPWSDVAHVFRSLVDGTSCTEALGWYGDAILCLTSDFRWTRDSTPWHRSFARAEQRSPAIASPNAMLADWIADCIFGFEWLARGSFEAAKRELQTRVIIADFIATRRRKQGARADRAMAEAIMICDLAGASQHWDGVVGAIERQLAAQNRL
jgi:hypothetical protein